MSHFQTAQFGMTEESGIPRSPPFRVLEDTCFSPPFALVAVA
jgi:hypothetical protein